MQTKFRFSGVEPIGHMAWGSHFCEFYSDKQDLVDTLVPYFAAGLASNEYCVWVTSKAIERDEAEELLANAVPQLAQYRSRGQIEFHDYRDWYSRGGSTLPGVLEQWLRKEQEAVRRGFEGLRLTGDTGFVERTGWDDFVEYERTVNEAFGRFRLIGLCTYHTERCTAGDVLDVMRNHQFALARRRGQWQVIEHPNLKIAKEELERRVFERTRELETAVRGRDEFLAMLGHELRNPLAPIRTAAELIGSLGEQNPQIAKIGEMLARQATHMSRMLDDLLDVARLTHGRINLELADAELNAIVAQAVEAAAPAARARELKLSLERADTKLPVRADVTRLAQVFGNLLDNAIKYTPNGGAISVELTVSADATAAKVSVADTGIGIAPEYLAKVFDLFAQEQRPVDRTEGGLGLGLAVVRTLVGMHGGSVTVHSEGRHRGASFEVELPLAAAALEHTASAPAATGVAPLRLLVVDDNRDAADSLAMLLSLNGHDVHVAHDGPEALDAAVSLRPDVVVLDIGLPGMDGYEVTRRIRSRPDLAKTALLAVTGYGQPEDRARAFDAGFDAHLVKPVQIDVLQARIEAIARRSLN